MVDVRDMSDAELEAFLASARARRGQQTTPTVGTAEDIARAIPRAVRDAVTGIAGMPVDIANLGMRAGTALYNRTTLPGGAALNGGTDAEAPQIPAGGSETFRNLVDAGTRAVSPEVADALNYQPQTVPGNLARGAVDIGLSAAIPAAALGSTGRMVTRLGAIGGVAGAAGEGMDALAQRAGVPEGGRAALRTGTTLATAILGNRSLASQGNAARMLAERTASLTPIDWRAARNMEIQAQRAGVPLFGGEPFGPPGTPVQRMTADVRASPQGGPIDRALAERQGQVQGAVAGRGGFLERISPDADPSIPADLRTQATQPLYRRADMETVPAAAIDPIIQQAAEAAARTGIPDLQRFAAQIGQASRNGNEFQIGPLSTLYQNTRDDIARPAIDPRAVQSRTRGELGEINPQLNAALEANNPTYQQAQQTYRDMSPRVDAAQTRADYATAFDQALNAGGSQVQNPLVGARFAQSIRGRTGEGAQRAPEFDQRIRDAAVARGAADPDGAVRSANDFLDNLAYTNQIPGVNSATAGRMAAGEEAGRNAVSTLARALNVTRGSILDTIRTATGGATRGATYRRLADVLASPNGVAEMERLIIRSGRNPLTQVQLGNLAAALEVARTPELVRQP